MNEGTKLIAVPLVGVGPGTDPLFARYPGRLPIDMLTNSPSDIAELRPASANPLPERTKRVSNGAKSVPVFTHAL